MGETFDVYDEEDRWIGTAERSEVHARGLWHRSFHCWLARAGEGDEVTILFQQRSSGKDTNPDKFDITAAGHLVAGETPREAVRELEEELGVAIGFDQLTPFGTVREEDEGTALGIRYIDREVSYVYGCVSDFDLTRFRLQEEEVAGVYEARASDLIALMEGKLAELLARGIVSRGGLISPSEASVTRSAFVPRSESYYLDVFKRLRELAGR
ncbi:NUDIX hydrolase [Cohnella yongneupensis]|uniref:NUDIX domain-containing protein n=1 Tax=Cohnella yongneupensis TaxID=425006 RepID=A0ABW0R3F0_9BACL